MEQFSLPEEAIIDLVVQDQIKDLRKFIISIGYDPNALSFDDAVEIAKQHGYPGLPLLLEEDPDPEDGQGPSGRTSERPAFNSTYYDDGRWEPEGV